MVDEPVPNEKMQPGAAAGVPAHMMSIRLACLLTLLLASRQVEAQADPRSLETIEEYEKAGDYLACAEGYEEMARNAHERDQEEVLYNAGVCFEKARSIGRAIGMYRQLVQRFPASRLSQKAFVRLASAYASIASFGEAAHWYEMYAKRYAGEKDAPAALSNAFQYRSAIGDIRAAVADAELFVKHYGKKLKQESADLLFTLPGMHQRGRDEVAARRGYRRYIVQMGKAGGLDRLLIANARAGELAWKASCTRPTSDGSCLAVKRLRPTRAKASVIQRCGPQSILDVDALARDAAGVKEARAFFARAVALGRGGAIERIEDPERRASALYWLTASRFYLAEEKFESFFALELPANLEVSAAQKQKQDRSKELLADFIKAASQEMSGALAEYEQIRQMKEAGGHWAIAAAARVGQLSQQFGDTLLSARVPAGIRSQPGHVDAYCGQITSAAAPLEELAVGAFGFCLELSKDLNWFNGWSRECEARLGILSPDRYPMAAERYEREPLSGDPIARVGLLSE